VNITSLLFVIVDVLVNIDALHSDLPGDTNAAVRQLYSDHAQALRGYVRRFCPDHASADDIVQETFIRAWRHPAAAHPGRPPDPAVVDPGRAQLLTDADRAARSRPVTVPAAAIEDPAEDSGLGQVLDRRVVADALQRLSPAHRSVLVEAFYHDGTTAMVARQLGIPDGTARSRLHYALHALRRHLEDQDATGSR